MAPITPFITERVWQDMVLPVTPDAPESVHLADYPVADDALIDPTLSTQMAACPPAGRARPRGAGGVGHQDAPAAVPGPGLGGRLRRRCRPELLAQIAAELNVGSVVPVAAAGGSLVDTTAKANFRALGKRFGKGVQEVATAIAAADAAALR